MKKFKFLMKIATVCLCCVLVLSLVGCGKSVKMTDKFDEALNSVLLKMGEDSSIKYELNNSEVGNCLVSIYAWGEDDEYREDIGIKFNMSWDSGEEGVDDYSCSISFSTKANGKGSIYMAFSDKNYGLTADVLTLKDKPEFSGTFWRAGDNGELTNSGNAKPAEEYVSARLVSIKETLNSALKEVMNDTNVTIDDLYVQE